MLALTAYGVMHPGPRAWLSQVAQSREGTRGTQGTQGGIIAPEPECGVATCHPESHLVGFIGDAMHTTKTRAHPTHLYTSAPTHLARDPFLSPPFQLSTTTRRRRSRDKARRKPIDLIDFLPGGFFISPTHPSAPASALPPVPAQLTGTVTLRPL